MSKNNNSEQNEINSICCPKCGVGVELIGNKQDGFLMPQHFVKASHQGSKGKICRASNKAVTV